MASPDINSLAIKVAALETRFTVIEAQMAVLQSQMKALQGVQVQTVQVLDGGDADDRP